MTKTARWITEHISSYIIRGPACILVCGRVSWYVTFEMALHIVIYDKRLRFGMLYFGWLPCIIKHRIYGVELMACDMTGRYPVWCSPSD